MSKAKPLKVVEEQPQQEEEEEKEEGGNARESRSEKPQSMVGTPEDPGDTPDVNAEPKATEDCTTNTEGTRQAKMQSIFSQVRNQIKSQVGVDLHKQGILDVVHRVTRERAKENRAQKPSQSEGKGEEEIEGEKEEEGKREEEEKREEDGKRAIERESKAESAGEKTLEGGLAALRGELLASIETLRNDLKEEMALLRVETREFTYRAVKDLEAKALSRGPKPQRSKLQPMNSSEQQLPSGAKTQERQKSFSIPSLVPGRPRILGRTMTTLNPKTCHPVVLMPRSKSETHSLPGENKGGLLLLENSDCHVFATRSNKHSKVDGNLPPTCPPLRHSKKLVKGKGRLGNSTTK